MINFKFNATKKITAAFDKHEVKYQVREIEESEHIIAGFPVDGGTNIIMSFISTDDENDVAARIFGLITRVPEHKRVSVIETCNALNLKFRFFRFILDSEGDVNVEYDFPVSSSDACVGEMAFEIFIRAYKIASFGFEVFMRILYADSD